MSESVVGLEAGSVLGLGSVLGEVGERSIAYDESPLHERAGIG